MLEFCIRIMLEFLDITKVTPLFFITSYKIAYIFVLSRAY